MIASRQLHLSTLAAASALLLGLLSPTLAQAAVPPAPVPYASFGPDDPPYGALTGLVTWKDSPDTPDAVVCYQTGATAPTSPVASAAVTCSDTIVGESGSGSYSFDVDADTTYSASVFSYDPDTGLYGSAVSASHDFVIVPEYAIRLHTAARSAHTVVLHWAKRPHYPPNFPSRWEIWVRRGTTLANSHSTPTFTQSSAVVTRRLTGLVSGEPYTVSIRAKDDHGVTSVITSTTFSTRPPGVKSLLVGAAREHKAVLPSSSQTNSDVEMTTTATGRLFAFYQSGSRLLLSSRTATGTWSPPIRLGSEPRHFTGQPIRHDRLYLSTDNGNLVVGWSGQDHWYYRLRKAGRPAFSAAKLVMPFSRSASPGNLLVDGRGKLHVLDFKDDAHVEYRTNESGRWTVRQLGPVAVDARITSVALTLDTVTRHVVIAETGSIFHRVSPSTTSFTIRMGLATLGERATTPSKWAKVRAVPQNIEPTIDVVSKGGHITVGTWAPCQAIGELTFGEPRPCDLYLLHGHGIHHVGGLTYVPGVSGEVDDLVLSATSATRTELAWWHNTRSWRVGSRAMFVGSVTWRGATAHFGHVTQVSSSPYSRPIAIRRLSDGGVVLGYTALASGDNDAEPQTGPID